MKTSLFLIRETIVSMLSLCVRVLSLTTGICVFGENSILPLIFLLTDEKFLESDGSLSSDLANFGIDIALIDPEKESTRPFLDESIGNRADISSWGKLGELL